MAQENQNQGNANTQPRGQREQGDNTQKGLSPDVQRLLSRIGCTGYTLHGYQPSAGEWRLTIDQIRDIVLTISKGFVEDIEKVTIETDHRQGKLYGYVWLPTRSSHITNNELNNGNSAIRKTMVKYSQPLKEYIDKFGTKGNKRLIPAEDTNEYRGIAVEISKFLRMEFDENAFNYGKVVGDKYKRKTTVKLKCKFGRGDDGRFGKLQYVEVRKEIKGEYVDKVLRPKRSFNIH
jgi:hypothetical protein